jgi:hypothetical protein
MKTNSSARSVVPATELTDVARVNVARRSRRSRLLVHPVLHGNRRYLRALRAAEMVAWEENMPREIAEPFAEAMARTHE